VEPYDAGDDEAGGDKPASCGDGVIQTGEDCDDRDSDDTDGCNKLCKLAGISPAATATCPGLAVHVWGGSHTPSLTMTTAGSGNRSANPACSDGTAATGAAAADRVFKVTAHKTGTMTVAATDSQYDVFLYASDACNPAQNTYLKCTNKKDGVGDESLAFPVVTGKSYYVFVDGSGAGAKEGTVRVAFSIP